MCKVLKVSRSSYYNFLKKRPSKRELENQKIEIRILEIHDGSKQRYGAPKIHKTLESEGINISLKRVQRIMRKLDIRSIITKKYRAISSKKKVECRNNILDRNFNTKSINEKWVSDMTYIHTIKDGWCYLASVMDLHSKKIVGHAMSKNIDTNLALGAVKNAMLLQKPTASLVLHSDLGCQYTSSEFQAYISDSKILNHSFSSKGCPYDNAPIESFHASLKKEEVNIVTYYDFNAAKLAIFEYIESWYNLKRIHGSIGYITPQQCEDKAKKVS